MEVGVLGLGRIGKIHVDHIQSRVRGLNIRTVYSPNVDPQWVLERGIGQATRQIGDVLNDQQIEGVAIFSSTNQHVSLIRQSLEAGKKYIFCEKPVSSNLSELRQLAREVSCSGAKLMVGFNRRFDPSLEEIRNDRENSLLGSVERVSIYNMDGCRPDLSFAKHSGGYYFDMAIHDFDCLRFLAGQEVIAVQAMGSVLIEPKLKALDDVDTVSIMLMLESGAHGLIQGSRENSGGYYQSIKIFGSKECRELEHFGESRVVRKTRAGSLVNKPYFSYAQRYKESMVAQMQSFSDLCNTGDEPRVGLDDCLKAVEIATAAQISQRESRMVYISELES